MFRKLALFTTGALALSSLAIIAPAGAAVAPADGSITCNVDGQADLKPFLPMAISQESTKAGKIQVKKAAVTACDATNVTGGKATITGGTLDMKASTPPGSCERLAAQNPLFGGSPDPLAPPLLIKPSATLKLTGLGPTGKPTTVAALKLLNVTAAVGATGFDVTATIGGTPGKNAFAGKSVTTTIGLSNLAELVGCIAGADNPTIAATAAGYWALLGGGAPLVPAPLPRFAFQYDATSLAPLQSTISIG